MFATVIQNENCTSHYGVLSSHKLDTIDKKLKGVNIILDGKRRIRHISYGNTLRTLTTVLHNLLNEKAIRDGECFWYCITPGKSVKNDQAAIEIHYG